MFEVGQQVRFVGRGTEQERYHTDYKQLLGRVGTVMSTTEWPMFSDGSVFSSCEVRFEGFTWAGSDTDTSKPADWFICWHNELEAA
jgi:hypothetical protein